ncbi:MAG: hypothetical protein ACRESW_02395, partial [Nevskiales bacterium]
SHPCIMAGISGFVCDQFHLLALKLVTRDETSGHQPAHARQADITIRFRPLFWVTTDDACCYHLQHEG